LPFLEAAGRYPDGPGSEETDRRAGYDTEESAPTGGRLALPSKPQILATIILRGRARMHIAELAALGLIVLLALLVPLRTLHITADGKTIAVRSRNVDSGAVVQQAGVPLHAGDVVAGEGSSLVVQRAKDVVLDVDGKTYTVRAQAGTIEELLNQVGVTLERYDGVTRNGVLAFLLDPVATKDQLSVRRAVPITVIENGQHLDLRSSRTTVATALRDGGVRLGAGDNVRPSLDTQLSAGLEIHVDHARALVITLPAGKSTLYTVASTVGEALSASGVVLPADYRLDPPAETVVSAGLAVHVIGITEQRDLETERIQSYVVYKPDPGLPHGAQRVVAGQDGVHYRQYQLVSEDGTQVSRQLASQWDDPPAQDTVIYYSTAPAPAPVVASAGNWRDLVCSYDWDCNWAIAVIACESGGNPDARSPAGYVGLFQIWEGYSANLTDPATNIAAAYSLYQANGRGNWPNCP
jgi:uncharacterized protein YabE (DUF348 family)